MIEEELVFADIIEATRLHLSHVKPSEWYESRMVMPRGSAFPGPFSYDLTPYWREPVDCASKDHPAKEISIMKGAQLGGTVAVLNPIVGYTITQNPGNIMFLTGHSDLSQAAFLKIDTMIDNCGMRDLIRPNVIRAKKLRSGDTDSLKEFSGGDLKGGSVTNHNLLRQHDVMIMIVDDFDAAAMFSKQAGSTRELVQKRTSAFMHKKKIYYVSSPQIRGLSNIDSVFQMGDMRYYKVPCPLCSTAIVLKWKIAIDNKESAGITWKLNEHGHLDRKSVGYICPSCAGFFNDSAKYEMNKAGFWEPTAIPKEENHYSYQISSLYSPPGMDDWAHYVQQYVNANPVGGKANGRKNQTFVNVVLGETYDQEATETDANTIQSNVRDYKIGMVPELTCAKDGNGIIVMLTCACDLNGTENDARLDYEIVAWSETQSSYSVKHGSIGTFVPREGEMKNKKDREKWTYNHNREKSVWPELEKVLTALYETDAGRKMKVVIAGVDTGHYTKQAYDFIDTTKLNVIGLKGNKENQYRKFGVDLPIFKPALERTKLFLLDVNHIKDTLSEIMTLTWNKYSSESQPPGFMNYPTPGDGLYGYENFFAHYQAEKRTIESKDGEGIAAKWIKKGSDPNHFWDVYVYNIAMRDIWCALVLAMSPLKKGNWADFINLFKNSMR